MLIGASADIAAAEVEIENTSRVEMPTLVSTAGRTSDRHRALPNRPVDSYC
jgi:hypothetical protein